MGSRAKQVDIDIRKSILEIMAVCIRMHQETGNQKYLDHAREHGAVAAMLKRKIATYDYSQEDKIYANHI